MKELKLTQFVVLFYKSIQRESVKKVAVRNSFNEALAVAINFATEAKGANLVNHELHRLESDWKLKSKSNWMVLIMEETERNIGE